VSSNVEDKAVDLYVLEKAFLSTHTESEKEFDKILEHYKLKSKKAGTQIMARLDEGTLTFDKSYLINNNNSSEEKRKKKARIWLISSPYTIYTNLLSYKFYNLTIVIRPQLFLIVLLLSLWVSIKFFECNTKFKANSFRQI